MNLAPLVVFAFERPDHLRRTLQSVVQNAEAKATPLIVYLDHPRGFQRTEKSRDVEAVARDFAENFASFALHLRPYNYGLSWNIINGVSEVLERHERVIVLEDDMVVSPDFLRYMNTALEKYAQEPRVASIHAYVYPGFDGGRQAFWMRGTDCWGWGTWRRAWKVFEPDARILYTQLRARKLEYHFNGFGRYDYMQMLWDHEQGLINSWAVRWHASAFLRGMLTLQPPRPLVTNIGMDGSGIHSGENPSFLRQSPAVFNFRLPEKIQENTRLTKRLFAGFVQPQHSPFGRFQFMLKSFKRQFRRISGLFKPFFRKLSADSLIWRGDYPNWESALADAGGYDAAEIAQRCFRAAREVAEGRAVAERDSVLLDRQEVRWPVLAGLQMALDAAHGEVVDFGGAFGSAFRMFAPFLGRKLDRWTVVEQASYVQLARTASWEEKLFFSDNLDRALDSPRLAAVLISSSLQYVPRPDLIIKAIEDHRAPYIILDRTSVWPGPNRITVQTVPPSIYKASYPAWFFNEKWLLALFQPEYELIADFPSLCTYFNLHRAEDKGYIFRRRDLG